MPGVYLGEPYADDRPGTQVMVAPGSEEVPIIEGLSPYVFGRMVRVPARQWHRLLLAVQDEDPHAAELLDRWSGSADPDDEGLALPQAGELAAIEEALSGALAGIPRWSDSERTSAWDYERIADAVRAVLRIAFQTGDPLTAWFE